MGSLRRVLSFLIFYAGTRIWKTPRRDDGPRVEGAHTGPVKSVPILEKAPFKACPPFAHPPRNLPNPIQAKLTDFGGLGMDTGPAVVSAKVLAHDFLTGEAPGKPSDVYGAYLLFQLSCA